MNDYSYSFVVATYGREIEIDQLINSLYAQTYKKYEIIVIDQNEHGRVRDLCSKKENINYIHTNKKGLSRARNIGIENAKGEFLVFPDDDSVLASDFLKEANELIAKFTDIYIFSGKVLTFEDNKPFSRYMDSVSEEIALQNFNKFMSTTMIINRQVFDSIGSFDEELGVGSCWGGSEEAELLLRSISYGYRAYYSTALIAYHPKADFASVGLNKTILKGYNYGLGRGAMFRKLLVLDNLRTWWVMTQWVTSLIISITGIGKSMIVGQWKDMCRHCGALLGRLIGFVLAKARSC